MLYPLYHYYDRSLLPLSEIAAHYVRQFYLPKYGQEKLNKTLRKLSELSALDKIVRQSIEKRVVPSNTDFCTAVNSSFWFAVQSRSTQTVAVLTAASLWLENVNSKYNMVFEPDFKKDIIKVFQKFDLYGEMTQMEFEMGAIYVSW